MKRWIRFTWRWSWLVTLPATIVFVSWAWSTARVYGTFGVRYDSFPHWVTVYRVGQHQFAQLLRGIRHAFISPFLSADGQRALRSIHLFVSEPNLAQLNSRLPHSGFTYVSGGLVQGDRLHQVRLRYRGDFPSHWAYDKKSIRVRTQQQFLFEGLRDFNLIASKYRGELHNHLGYLLASRMGLIAPRTEMVNLILNGKLHGVYNFVEQPEESTLRRLKRMPGDLYAGELLAKDSYRGTTNNIFHHPGLWEKVATNNHYPDESREPLKRLLALINATQTEAVQEELAQLLDLEAFGRFSAFEVLTQSFHYDLTHNWRLYYDPWRTQFEPVAWDPMAWVPGWMPKEGESVQMDIVCTRFHHVLFQNGDFLRARQRALEDFFRSGLDQEFLKTVDACVAAVIPAIQRDPHLCPGLYPVPVFIWGSDRLVASIRQVRSFIKRVMTEVKEAYLGTKGEVLIAAAESGASLAISVAGRRPVRRLILHYRGPIAGLGSATLRYWVNGREVRTDVSGAVTKSGKQLTVDTPLLPRYVPVRVGNHPVKANRMAIKPAYYELILEGIPEDNRLVKVLADRGDGPESAIRVSKLKREEFQDTFAIVHAQPARRPLIWEGTVEIEGVQEIQDELILRPGTTVLLHPGASLILHNRLLVKGTAERPVRFLPVQDDQEPWGTVALKGRGASGSRLVHAEFAGGSGLKGDLFEYSAQFSIHDVDGVVVEQCRFRDGKLVDDMVHAVYADVTFRDTTFVGGFADGLDLDISHAVIERCVFRENGNDGIDLMMTRAAVVDTLFEGNGDKGLSVGDCGTSSYTYPRSSYAGQLCREFRELRNRSCEKTSMVAIPRSVIKSKSARRV